MAPSQPPASVENGPSVPAPDDNSIYIPGAWQYQNDNYLWRPGYWIGYRPDWADGFRRVGAAPRRAPRRRCRAVGRVDEMETSGIRRLTGVSSETWT